MTHFHVYAGASGQIEQGAVRTIGFADLADALRRGFDDFRARPSHLIFLGLIYPVAGVFLASMTAGRDTFQLLYPLASGFALLGPFAALGLYEISRRRELGLDTSWRHAFAVLRSPAIPSIAAVGALLVALFLCWLLAANTLYLWAFGDTPSASLGALVRETLTTSQGMTFLILGNALGFVFAVIVLCTTVIAFPLLIDRDVGAAGAVETSVRAVIANPGAMAVWGIIVAAGLLLGSLPLFAGLAVVVPVLGHATWHLYRKVIEPVR